MELYFENFSLEEKLYEYSKLSARKQALEMSLLNYINENINEEFNKLKSGDIDNIIEIGDVIDKIIEKIELNSK